MKQFCVCECYTHAVNGFSICKGGLQEKYHHPLFLSMLFDDQSFNDKFVFVFSLSLQLSLFYISKLIDFMDSSSIVLCVEIVVESQQNYRNRNKKWDEKSRMDIHTHTHTNQKKHMYVSDVQFNFHFHYGPIACYCLLLKVLLLLLLLFSDKKNRVPSSTFLQFKLGKIEK